MFYDPKFRTLTLNQVSSALWTSGEGGRLSVYCMMFSGFPGLYPPDEVGIPAVITKIVSDIFPWGAKSLLVENCCIKLCFINGRVIWNMVIKSNVPLVTLEYFGL